MARREQATGVLAAVVLAVAALAGCGAGGQQQTALTSASNSAPAGTTVAPDGRVRPVEVRVPRIGAQSSLIAVAVRADGSMQVPSADKPMQAAWYRLGPVPGDVGPAVILGHVDGRGQPGVFYRLHELEAGDEVFVAKADGSEIRFIVDRREQVPKSTFPHEAVYGDRAEPELRLITCGGSFDDPTSSYVDNVVVYARLAA
jgi:Sortase domain